MNFTMARRFNHSDSDFSSNSKDRTWGLVSSLSETHVLSARTTEFENEILAVDNIESRDNPFVPGGELSREAEALLQSSTIIRDRFYIRQEDGDFSDPDSPQAQGRGDNCVVEETVLAESAKSTYAAQKPRENGKIEDSSSPESVKVEFPVSQSSPQKDGVIVSDDQIKDKKKKNKCCSVM